MSRIGFLGTGHIAAPMVRYLAGHGHEVLVSQRNKDVSAELAKTCGVRILDNQSVVDGSDSIFICLRPAVWEAVIAPLTFQENQKIISVMAGVPLSALKEAVAPAEDISITIPIGFLEQGGCPLPVFPSAQGMHDLFGADNPVLAVPSEDGIAAYFAASALISGVLTMMKDGASWLGAKTGSQTAADTYVTALVAGFLRDIPLDGQERIMQARSEMATAETLNLAVVEALEASDLKATIEDVLTGLDAKMRTAAKG